MGTRTNNHTATSPIHRSEFGISAALLPVVAYQSVDATDPVRLAAPKPSPGQKRRLR
jgi:hypothetical protein